jgi:fumarate hydratase class II
MHIAAARAIASELIPSLAELHRELARKQRAFAKIVKIGRTHTQDATPLTLGQEFSGYATQVANGTARLRTALRDLYPLAQGGTAVGTGLNASPKFARTFAKRVAVLTRLPFTSAPNKFEALAAHDAYVFVHGAINSVATGLFKIANDIRLLGSGPRSGLGELILPENEPGSSIMPGKVNPVICEAVCQVCTQVIGNDAAVAFGGAAGNFELNVMMPVIARNLLASGRLLASVLPLLADRCVAGITAHPDRMRRLVESSPVIVTALNRYLGYEAAAQVAHEALARGEPIRSIVIAGGFVERGEITSEQLDAALDVLAMTRLG